MNKRRLVDDGPRTRPRRSAVRYISGVLDYVKLSSPDRTKKVLLFSDYHIPYKGKGCAGCDDTTCPDFFISVLEDIISSAGRSTVDLYIEQDILPDTPLRENKNILLGLTREYFDVCHSKNKTACKSRWPNLRYHYADARVDSRVGLYTFQPTNRNEYMNDMMYCYLLNEDKVDKKTIVTILDEYLKKFPNYSRVLRDFIRSARMRKQYAGIPENVRRRVFKTICRVVKERALDYGTLQKHVSYLIETGRYDAFDAKYLIYPLVGLMDMYLMTRAFRHFNGSPQDKIVIYAGVAHIDEYLKIFVELGYLIEHQSETVKTRNLDGLQFVKTFCKKVEDFDKWW